MALLTLADGRTELGARGYSTTQFTTAQLNTWLNSAKNRFEDYPYDWPWLKATTSGTAPITISDLRRVRSVTDPTNRRSLSMVSAEDVTEFEDTNLALAGPAEQWYLTSETVLATFPVGTNSLNVRYVKFSPELSADGDTPLIPARYRQTWVDLAEVDAIRYGVKDQAEANTMEVAVFRRIEEIAVVYSMQDMALNAEQVMSGASTDG